MDGCADINALVRRTAELGMSAIALTDHGALHGAVQLSNAATRFGVKPIIGAELNVVAQHDAKPTHHLTVLAKNERGYQNLVALTSAGFLNTRAGYSPEVTKEKLADLSEGLIVLSGCSSAEVSDLIKQGMYEKAKDVAKWYKDVFGADYFLELIDHGLAYQKNVNDGLVRLHRELEIDLVATNDVHYLVADDVDVHEVLKCIESGNKLDDPDRPRTDTNQRFLKSPQEMAALFRHIPEALTNTVRIAEACTFDLFEFPVSLPVYRSQDTDRHGMDLLRHLVMIGLKRRYGGEPPAQALNRAENELSVIKATGFTDYFLIVWDLVQFARRSRIPVGPGRGSAASSIVAFALEITDVNPLDYGLMFERFLNPQRVTMPDIDIDFCFERRPEMLAYAADRFGHERVAQIATFGTLTARAAIRDVGRVLNIANDRLNRIARHIPAGPGMTLDEALHSVPELRSAVDNDPQMTRLVEVSRRVEGIPRHLSVHAAGIIIAPRPLTESAPLCKTGDGTVVTQFTGEDLESLGYLKMDLLGLRTLTVVDNAQKLITERRGADLNSRDLPLEDRAVYELLCSGETEGIFQLETGMFQQLLRQVKPKVFEDVVAILALGRPGPMTRLDEYLRFRHRRALPRYPHPALEEILSETSGIMLYQEQVMRIVADVAGYSLADADLLRRAISQSTPGALQGEQDRFVESSVSQGLDATVATQIFEDITRFAKYGFPKSHSVAYAHLAYTTAYLKTYFPNEYLAALLNSVMGNLDRTGRYIKECRRLGIDIKAPDVNASGVEFTVESDGSIRFGLGAVKYVGKSFAAEIVRARQKGPFRSLDEFVDRIAARYAQRNALESLLKIGAFASIHPTRALEVADLDELLNRGTRWVSNQTSLFSPAESGKTALHDDTDRNADYVDDLLQHEIELLGTYVRANPLGPYQEVLGHLERVDSRQPASGPGGVIAGGVVLTVLRRRTKKGDPMALVTLESSTGKQWTVILFPELYSQFPDLRPGHVMLVKGRVKQEGNNGNLIASEARMLEGIPLEIDVHDQSALQELQSTLRRHSGNRPVVLCIHGNEATARLVLPPRYWVHRNFDVNSVAGGGGASLPEGASKE